MLLLGPRNSNQLTTQGGWRYTPCGNKICSRTYTGFADTINLKDTMRCKIPITPAFGEVINATSEGLISDPTFKKLGIKAIHIEGMHHNLLSVHQVCTGENPAKNKSVSSHRRDANSSRCQSARRHSRLCQSVTTLSMDY